jgi:hypothetical protein
VSSATAVIHAANTTKIIWVNNARKGTIQMKNIETTHELVEEFKEQTLSAIHCFVKMYHQMPDYKALLRIAMAISGNAIAGAIIIDQLRTLKLICDNNGFFRITDKGRTRLYGEQTTHDKVFASLMRR